MKITINDERSILSVQQEFHNMFPYLKLEFFSCTHHSERHSPATTWKKESRLLGECRKSHASGQAELLPQMKVSEVEELFETAFGLKVQVFRKSGKSWLETVYTNDWTLAEQNSEGEELSKGLMPEEPASCRDDE